MDAEKAALEKKNEELTPTEEKSKFQRLKAIFKLLKKIISDTKDIINDALKIGRNRVITTDEMDFRHRKNIKRFLQ